MAIYKAYAGVYVLAEEPAVSARVQKLFRNGDKSVGNRVAPSGLTVAVVNASPRSFQLI